jgi:cell division protein FtsW
MMPVASQLAARFAPGGRCPRLDAGLALAALALMLLGLVMVSSASITMADRQLGQPFYFVLRQAIHLGLGLLLAALVLRVKLVVWERGSFVWLALALALLTLVLIPGLGREVNGSVRWLVLGPLRLQVSEPAKLLLILYLAGYLVRRGEEVRTQVAGFLKPMGVMVLAAILLLLEPDFGAMVVLMSTVLGMTFLAGVRLWQFAVLLGMALSAFALLAITSPYRLARLTAFLNPWADPFNSGFQLTQSLIAIGRGDLFGVGLGASIQKLFYLPEAHTDFIFSVLAEEFGLVGVLVVIALYAFVVWRAFAIAEVARQGQQPFAAYLAYGIGIWIGLQSVINMGVSMGLLPTKGLTLPLLSYGGSSLLVMCVAVALLLRIDYETRCNVHNLRATGTEPAQRRRARS